MITKFPSVASTFVIQHSRLMRESFLRITGNTLLNDHVNEIVFAENLFYAPFALVSHNTEEDPVFNYANQTALSLFECNWEEFISLPSRLSAEPVNQPERARLLAEVTSEGFINNYQGIRISKTGKRFWINKATVWNLLDSTGQYKGQAACFRKWELIQ